MVSAAACGVCLVGTKVLIPWLKRAGIVGPDVHKPGKPQVPEMGA